MRAKREARQRRGFLRLLKMFIPVKETNPAFFIHAVRDEKREIKSCPKKLPSH